MTQEITYTKLHLRPLLLDYYGNDLLWRRAPFASETVRSQNESLVFSYRSSRQSNFGLSFCFFLTYSSQIIKVELFIFILTDEIWQYSDGYHPPYHYYLQFLLTQLSIHWHHKTSSLSPQPLLDVTMKIFILVATAHLKNPSTLQIRTMRTAIPRRYPHHEEGIQEREKNRAKPIDRI